MNFEVIQALEELERERGVSKEILLEALEAALVSAFKRHYGSTQNVRVDLDGDAGTVRVFAKKTVVEAVTDPKTEITLDEARAISPSYNLGDIVEAEVTPAEFGRIAAQTAKQVVVQRIREAERDIIYEEYINRQGDIITGRIQRIEGRNVMVDLGRAEAILPQSEQMPTEQYEPGQRIKMYIVDVRRTTKGPVITVSRTHPGLIKRLLELEVPEVYDGVVEIKAIAREAGARSKVAVYSHDENVDPVGACVGHRGVRIQSIVSELRGEKIDVIEWSENPAIFVANSLSPAKVLAVSINQEYKIARVIVPNSQLSLAIGREGQNARLAARITGWKIDIKSEAQYLEMVAEAEAYQEAHQAAEQQEEELDSLGYESMELDHPEAEDGDVLHDSEDNDIEGDAVTDYDGSNLQVENGSTAVSIDATSEN
ncbi:MAG TPA: transcription termination factor NusA [Bacillota bacterium]|nr:transcription termination factor NusA [Bacillota bacterium]HPZ53918.1 transcription termination factor NusA [Bacillota bacterium]HQD18142.1 transcription termination factor NusA [Bacillota bacterium]